MKAVYASQVNVSLEPRLSSHPARGEPEKEVKSR